MGPADPQCSSSAHSNSDLSSPQRTHLAQSRVRSYALSYLNSSLQIVTTDERYDTTPADIDRHLVDAFEVVLTGAADCVEHEGAQAVFDELFLDG